MLRVPGGVSRGRGQTEGPQGSVESHCAGDGRWLRVPGRSPPCLLPAVPVPTPLSSQGFQREGVWCGPPIPTALARAARDGLRPLPAQPGEGL